MGIIKVRGNIYVSKISQNTLKIRVKGFKVSSVTHLLMQNEHRLLQCESLCLPCEPLVLQDEPL